jgi:hypothetical protein
LVAVLTSHPSVRLSALQSAWVPVQVPVQAPAVHAAVMPLDEHAWLQPPQWATVLAVSTSQPSVCLLPLQSARLVRQVPLQTPEAQVRVAMKLLEHTVPQPPQLSGSPAVLVSQPLVFGALVSQSVRPATQPP